MVKYSSSVKNLVLGCFVSAPYLVRVCFSYWYIGVQRLYKWLFRWNVHGNVLDNRDFQICSILYISHKLNEINNIHEWFSVNMHFICKQHTDDTHEHVYLTFVKTWKIRCGQVTFKFCLLISMWLSHNKLRFYQIHINKR